MQQVSAGETAQWQVWKGRPPCCWCHLYTFSCWCFSPGIIELPTIPVSTILSLPIIIPFFSSLILFHSSFSQLGKFEPRLHNHVILKQSLNDRQLWEYPYQRGYTPVTLGDWHYLVRKVSMFLNRKDEVLFIPVCTIAGLHEFKCPKPHLCYG